jgi:DNA integrity scanning protein DisA with diadenylate cyclase activity
MFKNNQYVYSLDFVEYFQSWSESLINLIVGVLDIVIAIFLLYRAIRLLKKTRAWQLLKGIAILIILTLVTRLATLWNIKCSFKYSYDISVVLHL